MYVPVCICALGVVQECKHTVRMCMYACMHACMSVGFCVVCLAGRERTFSVQLSEPAGLGYVCMYVSMLWDYSTYGKLSSGFCSKDVWWVPFLNVPVCNMRMISYREAA